MRTDKPNGNTSLFRLLPRWSPKHRVQNAQQEIVGSCFLELAAGQLQNTPGVAKAVVEDHKPYIQSSGYACYD